MTDAEEVLRCACGGQFVGQGVQQDGTIPTKCLRCGKDGPTWRPIKMMRVDEINKRLRRFLDGIRLPN